MTQFVTLKLHSMHTHMCPQGIKAILGVLVKQMTHSSTLLPFLLGCGSRDEDTVELGSSCAGSSRSGTNMPAGMTVFRYSQSGDSIA